MTRLHAREWGLDTDRVVEAGVRRAGTAAHEAADAGRYGDPALPPELAAVSPAVRGVIDYVGPSDFHTFWHAAGWARR